MKLRIKYLRQLNNMTQRELADKLSVSMQNVSKYELGGLEPGLDLLVRIADVFDVSVDYLLGRSNDPNPGAPPTAESVAGQEYISILGSNGIRKKVFIPPEKSKRFHALLDAGFPELMEE